MYIDEKKLFNAISDEMLNFLGQLCTYLDEPYDLKKYAEFYKLNKDFQIVLKMFNLIQKVNPKEYYKAIDIKIPEQLSNESSIDSIKCKYLSNPEIFCLYNISCYNTPITYFFNYLKYLEEKYSKQELNGLLNGNLDIIYKQNKEVLGAIDTNIIYFPDLDIEIVKYYSDVLRVYNYLTTHIVHHINNHAIFKFSTLLAIFLQQSKNDNITKFDAIIYILKKKNITIESILEILDIDIDYQEISNLEKQNISITDFTELYKKYKFLFHEIMGNSNEKSLTNIRLYLNLLSHGKYDKYDDSFFSDEMKTLSKERGISLYTTEYDITNTMEFLKKQKKEEKIKEAYSKLGEKEKEFITFLVKVLHYVSGMTLGLIESEEDAYMLALFLTIHKYNKKIDQFFADYGLDIDSIISILGININEINSKIDCEEYIDYDFYKIMKKTIMNIPLNPEDISIDDISLTIANKDLNPSRIINKIIQNISSTGEYIDDNYENKLIAYVKREKSKELNEQREHLFPNCHNIDSYPYIKTFEDASVIYNTLKESSSCLDEDLISISLLISSIINNDEIKLYFEHYGITLDNLYEYYDIKDSTYSLKEEVSYKIIEEKFRNYINLDNNLMTLISRIISNGGYKLNSLLSQFNLSASSFLNLEEKILEIVQENKTKIIGEKIKDEFEQFPSMVKKLLEDLLKIYKIISTNSNSILQNGNEQIILSLLLMLFVNENHAIKFFNKYGITVAKISEMYQISFAEIKEKITYTEPNYCDFELFRQFISDFKTINNVVNNLVENKDLGLLNGICDYLNVPSEILRREITSNTDIENLFTIDEKIDLLLSVNPNSIDIENDESVAKYGKELGIHSIYIVNEKSKLMQRFNIEHSLTEISTMLANIYKRTTKKKGLFSKFQKSLWKEVTIDDINEIRELIQTKHNELSQIVLDYIKLRKYMGYYKKINLEHINTATGLLEQLENKIVELDNDYIKKLEFNSSAVFLRNKIANFKVSDQLFTQNLVDITNQINMIYMKINVLEKAYSILLPALINYLMSNNDSNTSNVTHNLIRLLASSVNDNIEELRASIEMISLLDIDNGTATTLKNNIFEQIALLESKKNLEVSSNGEEILPIKPIQLKI